MNPSSLLSDNINVAAPRVKISPDQWAIFLSYLAVISIAEFLTVFSNARAGMIFHAFILVALILHSTLLASRPIHKVLLALALAPLIRVISLSLPLEGFQQMYWYLLIGLCLAGSIMLVINRLGLNLREIGLTLRGWPLQISIAVIGLPLGVMEYLILRPDVLVSRTSVDQILLAGLILMIFTGFLEEVIFRGVLQKTSSELLGNWGIVYISAIFAVLHLGHLSVVDVLFVFLVALLLAYLVKRTGSLLGASLAHGITNITLFLVMPLLLG